MKLFERTKSPLGWLRNVWFPRHEDATWKSWVEMEDRNYRSLCELVANDQMRTTYKARALIILLAPDEADVPIYWKKEHNSFKNSLQVGTAELEGLSAPLLGFIVELLAYACETLRTAKSKNHRDNGLWGCNQYITKLLKIVSIEEGERIWPYFLINDPMCYWNMETSSGYESWYDLMYDKEIPERWKNLADAQIREVIDSELSGKSTPREEWENAYRNYIEYIGSLISYPIEDGQLSYSVDLLAEQIDFILSKDASKGLEVIPSYKMATALQLLGSEKYHQTRQRLINFTISNPEYPFKICGDDDMQTAEQMLTTYHRSDDPGYMFLHQLIKESRPKVEEKQRQAKVESERKQAILDQMKV